MWWTSVKTPSLGMSVYAPTGVAHLLESGALAPPGRMGWLKVR